MANEEGRTAGSDAWGVATLLFGGGAGGDPRFGTLTTYMTTIVWGISESEQPDTPPVSQEARFT
jgi:hypothetical protein